MVQYKCGNDSKEAYMVDYITDEQVVKRAKVAVKTEIEQIFALDLPIVIYDDYTHKIYNKYSDGRMEEISSDVNV